MSQFEYLNRIPLGIFLPGNSLIHRLNPAVKIISFSIVITAITLTTDLSGIILAALLALFTLFAAKISFLFTLRGLRAALPFILILSVIQLFIASQQSNDPVVFSLGFLIIRSNGIQSALLLLLRFISLILFLNLASATISSLELIHGLEIIAAPLKIFGIETFAFAMLVQIMLRFMPMLVITAEKIAKAQASRGAIWDQAKTGLIKKARQVLPLLIPLFSNSLHQADTLTNAMLSRAYGSNKRRTGLTKYQFQWQDVLAILIFCSSGILILFFQIIIE